MLRSIKSPQRAPRAIHAIIEDDGSVTAGSQDVSVALASSVYTITIAKPFARLPIVSLAQDDAGILVLSSVAAGVIEVSAFDVDGTTPKDIGFHLQILGFDVADEY